MENIKGCLTSEHQYKFLKEIKQSINDNDEQTLMLVIQTLQIILSSNVVLPIQKVLGLRLVKELMDMHKMHVVECVSLHLLQLIKNIATFKPGLQDRGKYIFSDQPSEAERVMGNTLLRLSLECIFVWNIWHPQIEGKQSKFAEIYHSLVHMGVQFPKLNYFSSAKVKEFYIQSKECLAKSANFEIQSDSEFYEIKKKLETNQYNKETINSIIDSLEKIQTSNKHQLKFIQNLMRSYIDYQKDQNFDDFKISIQAICLEFDDETFDQQAAMDSFHRHQQSNNQTPSKIPGNGYSTDKYSQFWSQCSLSVNSSNTIANQPIQQKQIQILNEKDRRIEKLIQENANLSSQIIVFEHQVRSLKNSIINTGSNHSD